MVQGISNSNKMTLSSEKTESDIPTESYSVNRYLNKCQLTPESIKKLAEKLDILKTILPVITMSKIFRKIKRQKIMKVCY